MDEGRKERRKTTQTCRDSRTLGGPAHPRHPPREEIFQIGFAYCFSLLSEEKELDSG